MEWTAVESSKPEVELCGAGGGVSSREEVKYPSWDIPPSPRFLLRSVSVVTIDTTAPCIHGQVRTGLKAAGPGEKERREEMSVGSETEQLTGRDKHQKTHRDVTKEVKMKEEDDSAVGNKYGRL
ncbi:unnamed protein product [Peronospora belbahrii]|uniref:Uncharacterized protein n=1 Tax=Peronospora belbahrii TaxID=622444 RepID=A0AAU9KXH6_9STRA|nr:unnamed protein product [Peronospora belbahrii]CAH0517708.1 unnamed protein product [Peronospora belbahrii]